MTGWGHSLRRADPGKWAAAPHFSVTLISGRWGLGCHTEATMVHQKMGPQHPSVCCHSSSDGEGNGNPLQYSCLDNPIDGRSWWATVHGVAKSWTRLGDFTFTFHFHALEKELATHSNVLAWRIPWTEEPGRLLSTGSHRVGHNWSNLAAAVATAACFYHQLFGVAFIDLFSSLYFLTI